MTKLLPVALLATLSFFFTDAHAQLFGGDQARRDIAELREQMNARLEASSRGQLELANQNEMLRSEVARLRGDIEVLVHELESLKQRQLDFYVDLDSRLQRMEQTGGPAAVAASDPEVEAADYEAALTLLKEGKHDAALAAFENFVQQHPRSQSLANAHFWAGNAALQARNVGAAQTHFTTVLTNWPADRVAPDAMIGLANSQQALGDARRSQETLRRVIETYPQSSAAQVARQRLGQ